MQDNISVLLATIVFVILIVLFPIYNVATRNDSMNNNIVIKLTTEFVDDVRTTGKLTIDKYSKFVETISATGNTYDIEMELKVLDENPGKKTTQVATTKIGENVYYSMYTSQILDTIAPVGGGKATLTLKEGDIFSANVKNTNTTLSQQLKNFFYAVAGNDTYIITAGHAGIVTANGTGN